MRIDTFANGLIDDLYVEAATLTINRTGVAKYRFSIKCPNEILELALWTTQKGKIVFELNPIASPAWIDIKLENGQLKSLSAIDCSIHIEHCDRGLYSLALSQRDEHYGVSISSYGYIKAKIANGAA